MARGARRERGFPALTRRNPWVTGKPVRMRINNGNASARYGPGRFLIVAMIEMVMVAVAGTVRDEGLCLTFTGQAVD